jgi:hypothetical protein
MKINLFIFLKKCINIFIAVNRKTLKKFRDEEKKMRERELNTHLVSIIKREKQRNSPSTLKSLPPVNMSYKIEKA